MLNIYGHKGDMELSQVPAGGSDKVIWRDLKTAYGAYKRARRIWGQGTPFRLYSYSNLYDERTYKLIATEKGVKVHA